MYQTPRRMWRNICEIPNYGWVVWEIQETKYEHDKYDEYDVPDPDGYSMFVIPSHYWTRQDAVEHYLRPLTTPRFELILIDKKDG